MVLPHSTNNPSIMDTNKVLKSLLNVLTLSAVAAASFSCTVRQLDEDLQSAPNGERLEFTASIEDEAQTRSSVDANLNFYWSPGDQVSLFYGPSGNTAGSLFTAQNTEITQSTTFTGTISAFTGMGNDGVPLSFWSVSPYLASNRSDGNSVQATLPTVQQAVAENFASNTMLMVAKSYALSLSFKHVGAMLHIRMSRSDIVAVTFRGNAGETVAGRVSVTMDANDKPVWSPINGQGGKSVRLEKPDGFVAGTYYYLYFLPQAFPQGWSLTFETSNGKTGTYTSNNSITFARAASRNVNGLDAKVTSWKNSSGILPDYVEMGPGIYWATCNVGASSPEEYGDYFAWGETTPKNSFNWDNYKWGTQTSFSRYVTKSSLGTVDNLTTLLPEDDAATATLGYPWKTPTREDWAWLMNNCTWTPMDIGYLVTSNVPGYEGNSIFLPPGGVIYTPGPHLIGTAGCYWSSTLDVDSNGAYTCYFTIDASYLYHQESDEWRYAGLLVRPVRNDGDLYVDLGLPSGLKWAKCNLGAATPEEVGRGYAWGETEPKSGVNWSNYFDTSDGGNTFEKYATDKATRLELVDDAAHVALGGNFRIPTVSEWEELNNTKNDSKYTWTYCDGYQVRYNNSETPGIKIVRKDTGATLFLPIHEAGIGEIVDYWSADLSADQSTHAMVSYYSNQRFKLEEQKRYLGSCIRPVSD